VQAAAAKLATSGGLQSGQLEAICAEAATAASEALYRMSGKQFTGECGPVTARPVSRPTDLDLRGWGRLSPMGFFSSAGPASSYGTAMPGVVSSYGRKDAPEISFPFQINSITEVMIDGEVIPPDEYELRAGHVLVRLRIAADAVPTARYGWPTSQIPDLPLTELGTFGVTFMFGTAPPASGQLAARALALFLALPQLGDSTHYPHRVSQVTRQGVAVQVASALDLLKSGQTGIWEVDMFLRAFNPHCLQAKASVWSPDVSPVKRQATVTTL
jgi:hypothetical protein